MQTNVATPSKPTVITAWDLQEGCYSNTLLQDEILRIYAERKYYVVCGASLEHAMKCRIDTFRVGIRQNGAVRRIGFAWSGTNQSMDWLKEIAEHLVEDAWTDFQKIEDIEVEIKWPEKFSKTREYRPSGMSAREMSYLGLQKTTFVIFGTFVLKLNSCYYRNRSCRQTWREAAEHL